MVFSIGFIKSCILEADYGWSLFFIASVLVVLGSCGVLVVIALLVGSFLVS